MTRRTVPKNSQRVSDLTVDELRGLIREIVTETMAEILTDPDTGLELREEFQFELQQSLQQRLGHKQETTPIEDVARDLGLRW